MYLKDRNILITGISRGIGRSLALQLLDAGANVIGWGKTAPDYQHKNLHFFPVDIRNEQEVNDTAGRTLEKFGEIHFLINNAGFGRFQPIEKFESQVFQDMMDVNVRGMFLVSKAIVPNMQNRGNGHIINISSIAGRVGAPWGSGYNASKFAVSGLSESLFQELRKQGIKVTTVYPGSTKTHFFDEIPAVEAHDNMVHPDELASTLLHLMNTSPNFLVREIEIRPLNSKAPK